MNSFKTEQEQFWAGSFGDEYITRNKGVNWIANNLSLFANILSHVDQVDSLIEFGANVGMNLHALHQLLPETELSAVEINETAVEELKLQDYIKTYHASIIDFQLDYQRDLSLIKGVLIHISPECLPQVYDLLYNASKRYICIVEYYNPLPVEVPYRGHGGKLFKRDFAGEMLDRFQNLTLVHYGFVYHRDKLFPQGDTTWFLMEKR
jgi:spore coat polysaccharide biosynthesis protein SpsF